MSGISNIAINAIYSAGNILQQYSRNIAINLTDENRRIRILKQAILDVETTIISTLKRNFPDHIFLSTESSEIDLQTNKEHVWLIQAIDGVLNFINNIPYYVISIAYFKANKINISVIFNPNNNQLYSAELGRGAYLNNQRIRVNKKEQIRGAIIAGCYLSDQNTASIYFKDIMSNLIKEDVNFRINGCNTLDLAYIASGSINAFLAFDSNSIRLDANALLLTETGGRMMKLFYKNSAIIIAGYDLLLEKLITVNNFSAKLI